MQNINDKEKKTATGNIEIITAVKWGFMEEGESTKEEQKLQRRARTRLLYLAIHIQFKLNNSFEFP